MRGLNVEAHVLGGYHTGLWVEGSELAQLIDKQHNGLKQSVGLRAASLVDHVENVLQLGVVREQMSLKVAGESVAIGC